MSASQRDEEIAHLVNEAQRCRACPRMEGHTRLR
jgi:hypothetical protein